ncbi:MAG: hypothetical protein RBU23_11860 [Candidatus Auribacterota bacterium]|jgi:hypothetical protein|nr:hypothetical protein [Candidatus Auribacterota bacterium]
MKLTGIFVVILLGLCLLISEADAQTDKKEPQEARIRNMIENALEDMSMLSVNLPTVDSIPRNFIIMPVLRVGNLYYRCIGVAIDDTGLLIDFIVRIDRKRDTADLPDTNIWFKSSYNGLMCILRMGDFTDIKPFKDDTMQAMFSTYIDDIQRRRIDFMQAYSPDSPLEVSFFDGKPFRGVIAPTQRQNIDTLFGVTKQHRNSLMFYSEYEVIRNPDVPELSSMEFMRIKPGSPVEAVRYVSQKIVPRTGLFTNRTVWMGRNYLPHVDSFYESWRKLENYQLTALYSIVIYDKTASPYVLFLGDVISLTRIERVEEFSDKHEFRAVYDKIETSTILGDTWNNQANPVMYVEFDNRPPARGKLVEYVPAYHKGMIPHAVLEDTNGKLVALRNVNNITAVHVSDTIIDVDKENFDARIAMLYDIKNPVEVPLSLVKSDMEPVTIKSIQPFSNAITLTVTGAVLQEQSVLAGDMLRYIQMPDIYGSIILISMTFTDGSPVAADGIWLFYDEFTFYDNDGKVMPYTAFVGDTGLTDAVALYDKPKDIQLICVVGKDTQSLFMRFRDMPPFLIKKAEVQAVLPDNDSGGAKKDQ